MDDILVRATGVSKRYGEGDAAVTSLRDLTFEIAPRAHLAIMGPSGSGKSTMLQVIAGLIDATGGQIEWPAFGEKNQLRPTHIGITFQGPSLMAPLTVLENVALPLLLLGTSEESAAAAACQMIARFSLAELAAKLPEEISGGQAQRAGLARALITRPRLVLADEPTGQQDRMGSRGVIDTLLAVAEGIDASVVVATHDEEVAGRLDQRWSLVDGTLTTGGSSWMR
ncbi:MAG: ATP-binding cassette domain-containing protein [Actinomycetota bacterium]|nr:ATP-binding cassette domain-containing protein [Actinomycetota bacterium]